MNIKESFINRQSRILFLVAFGLLLLMIRDVPFLNVFFPENATLFVVLVAATISFRWYRSYIFFLILTVPTIVLSLTGSVSHAEQLAIFTFVTLFILIIDQTIYLFKDESK